jgi:hypothetical protein
VVWEIPSVNVTSEKTADSGTRLNDSMMLLASGPHPRRVDVELFSGVVLEIEALRGISSRSSTTSKQERLTQPRMSRIARTFLHIAGIFRAFVLIVNIRQPRFRERTARHLSVAPWSIELVEDYGRSRSDIEEAIRCELWLDAA